MHRIAVSLAAVVSILLSAGLALAAPTVALTPSSMTTTAADGLVVDVTGLVGTKVDLVVYVDVNQNGVVDAADYPVYAVVVTDNGAAAPNVPVDENKTAGAVRARLRMFTPLNFPYTAGRYVVRATDEGNGTFAGAALTITAAAETQSVQGQATVSGGGSAPGALVMLYPLNEKCAVTSPSTFADASGNFALQVPASFDACGERLLLALKPGYVSSQYGQPLLTFRGTDVYTGQTPTVEAAGVGVSGHLYFGGTTTPIPGALIVAQREDGPPAMAIAFTDKSGGYAMPLVAGQWSVFTGSDEHLALQGAVADDREANVTVAGSAISGVDLSAQTPNATVSGTVSDEGTPLGAGVGVAARLDGDCEGTRYSTIVHTTAGGAYTAGIYVPASCANQTTIRYHVVPADPVFGKVVAQGRVEPTAGGSYTAPINYLAPTHSVSGAFADAKGQALADLCLRAHASVDGVDYVAYGKPGCDGSYTLPVIDGTWSATSEVSQLAAIYRSLDQTTVERDVTVSGADVEGLNFVVGRWLFKPAITGVAAMAPKAGGQLLLQIQGVHSATDVSIDGTTYAGAVTIARADQGKAVVGLPAGLAAGAHQITITDSSTGLVSDPACFTSKSPAYSAVCTIGGTVRDAGNAALANAAVIVFDSTGNAPLWGAITNASGQWSAGMPQNTNYVVMYLPPQGTALAPAKSGVVACATGLTQQLASAYRISGYVTDAKGGGVSGATVSAKGGGPGVTATTDDNGFYQLPLRANTWTINYQPPIGSRYLYPASQTISPSADAQLPNVVLAQGNLVVGQIVGMGGAARVEQIVAHQRSDDATVGGTVSESCEGRFALAVTGGEYSLELINQPNDGAAARVEWVNASNSDVAAEFPFPAASAAPLQLDSSTLRVTGDLQAGLKAGGPFHFFAENIPATGTPQFTFSNGLGGTVAVANLVVDRARGLVAGMVPSGAASGPATFSVGAVSAAPVLANVAPGVAPTLPYTFSGTVLDSNSNVVPGTVLILMEQDPSNPDCNANPSLVSFGVSDASGNFSLPYTDGNLILMGLPPVAANIPAGYIMQGDASGDISGMTLQLLTGPTYTMRIVQGSPATPVPNARVSLDGNVFDTRLSAADGTVSFPIWGGQDVVVLGPAKSRLTASTFYVDGTGSSALGDVALGNGILVSGRTLDNTGAPLGGARARTRQANGNTEYGEGFTGLNGVFTVPAASGAAFNMELDPNRNDLGSVQSQHDAASHDLVFHPSAQFVKAGLIAGHVRAAENGAALGNIDVSAMNSNGAGASNIGWARSCPDGYYVMKVAAGQAFVQTWDQSGARAQVFAPGVFCNDNAQAVTVAAGSTTTVDMSAPLSATIGGTARLYRSALSGMMACVSGGALENGCTHCAMSPTGGDGAFAITVPAASGYRLEAWGGGLDRCYPHNACPSYVPVNAPASGLVINFGDAPGEAASVSTPTTIGRSSGNFVLTFPTIANADSYNVYAGALGTFYNPSSMATCHLAGGSAGFDAPGSGVATYTFAPPAGNAVWFLVSGSNVLAEGSLGTQQLGDGTTPERDAAFSAWRCGPTP